MTDDSTREQVLTALWECLEGGSYDATTIRASLSDESRLVADIGLDSLDLSEFYMRIEELFEIEIAEADYVKLTSIGEIISFLDKRSAETATVTGADPLST